MVRCALQMWYDCVKFRYVSVLGSSSRLGDRDLYLGHYYTPERASLAFDKAVICLRGPVAARYKINQPVDTYEIILLDLVVRGWAPSRRGSCLVL